jgi:hypothetical protein
MSGNGAGFCQPMLRINRNRPGKVLSEWLGKSPRIHTDEIAIRLSILTG